MTSTLLPADWRSWPDPAKARLRDRLKFDWKLYARAEQIPPPGDWLVWLILAGRGYGKTRTGAETAKGWAGYGELPNLDPMPGSRGAIVAPTSASVRDVCVEGESGLLGVLPADAILKWNRSIGELDLANGSHIRLFSADEPDRLRGYQHHWAWCDEPASWRYGRDTWDMLQFGLRLGNYPRTVVTGTPKPVPLIRELVAREAGVHVTRGSTFDNAANLAPAAIAELRARYEGTRLGRQELHAELLLDVEGALFSWDLLERTRVREHPDLARVVVAIDPSGGDDEGNSEQGIIVAGLGSDGDGYTLADRSCRLSPDGWGRRAVQAYLDHAADLIVAERNFGGDMVLSVVNQAAKAMGVTLRTKLVTASRGKRQRAEPVAALYEQQRWHHVGLFPELEEQLTSWTPESGTSPDRLDANVWAATELMLERKPAKIKARFVA